MYTMAKKETPSKPAESIYANNHLHGCLNPAGDFNECLRITGLNRTMLLSGCNPLEVIRHSTRLCDPASYKKASPKECKAASSDPQDRMTGLMGMGNKIMNWFPAHPNCQ
jgi:hypothetical protein